MVLRVQAVRVWIIKAILGETMKIHLSYGKSGLDVDFPDTGVDVIEPEFVEGLPDEAHALREALRHPIGAGPLKDLVRPDDSVAIIFPDRTRPMPSDRVLPIILSELNMVPMDQHYLDQCRWNTSDEHSRGTGVNAWKKDR